MQLISKFNKGFKFLLCVTDICIKYLWVIPLKDKSGIELPILLRKLLKNLIENQTKYGLIKAVNFIIDQWNHG